jgi:hypothetical protein
LLKVICPLTDAIGSLEHLESTLADVWSTALSTVIKVRKVELPSEFQCVKEKAIAVIQKRCSNFIQPLYLVALFLSPKYKQLAVSRKYSLLQITGMIKTLAQKWNFKEKALDLMEDQVRNYYNEVPPFNSTYADPSGFWLCLRKDKGTMAIREFARLIFSIIPHSAGVEQLFSVLGYLKKKSQGKMKEDTLIRLGQIRNILGSPYKNVKATKDVKEDFIEHEFMTEWDEGFGFGDFEEGCERRNNESNNLPEDGPEVSRENAFFESLFNFDEICVTDANRMGAVEDDCDLLDSCFND